jgi:hypothetical protein
VNGTFFLFATNLKWKNDRKTFTAANIKNPTLVQSNHGFSQLKLIEHAGTSLPAELHLIEAADIQSSFTCCMEKVAFLKKQIFSCFQIVTF